MNKLFLDRLFKISERNSTISREIIGGATTFFALSYIIFVQPAVLSNCGMDFGAVMTATILSSVFACVVMAFTANYPIALAPGMGHNFFFTFTLCGAVATGGFGFSWQQGLTAVLISGSIFLLLAKFGFRSAILNSVPEGIQQAISAGIGLFIALIGFKYANIIVVSPTGLSLGKVFNPITGFAVFGLIITIALHALKVPAAILFGMLATLVLTLITGYVHYEGVISVPPSISPTFFKFDFSGLFHRHILEIINIVFVLFFLDLFDTIGTLIGVSTRAGLMKNGKLPKAEAALTADAAGTAAGAMLGTSTVTCYIESAAGVDSGARTGFANLVTAALMLCALFFLPLTKMIGGGIEIAPKILAYPIIAPALILVGASMMQSLVNINWKDPTEGIPAFLTLAIIPYSFSISNGIAFGFISYSLAKILTGRWRECPWLVYLFAVLFMIQLYINH